MTTYNSEIRLEVASDLSIFEAENNLTITKTNGVTGINAANNTIDFDGSTDLLYFPEVGVFAENTDTFLITGEVSFNSLSGSNYYPFVFGFYNELSLGTTQVGSDRRFRLSCSDGSFSSTILNGVNINTTETYAFRVERDGPDDIILEIVPSVSSSDSITIQLLSTLELEGDTSENNALKLGGHDSGGGAGNSWLDGTISNFVAKTTRSNITPTTTTTTTTTTASPWNSEIRLEVESDLSISSNINIESTDGHIAGINSANNTIEFGPDPYDGLAATRGGEIVIHGGHDTISNPKHFADAFDDYFISGTVSFDVLSHNQIFRLIGTGSSYETLEFYTDNTTSGASAPDYRFRFQRGSGITLISNVTLNTSETYYFKLQRISGIHSLEIIPSVSSSDTVTHSNVKNYALPISPSMYWTIGKYGTHPSHREFAGTLSNFVAKSETVNNWNVTTTTTTTTTTTAAPANTTTTTTTTTTPCPEPNPPPDCEHGRLVAIHHPDTGCLIGYSCIDVTTTTTARPEQSCAVEDKGCFREEQRSRRIRPAPQDSPYFPYAETTTTTTTTQTPIDPIPSELLALVSIPDSGNHIQCPTIEPPEPPSYFDAFGGNNTFTSGNMIFHEFYDDGIFYITPYNPTTFNKASVNLLIIGGGGGGGAFVGSGGGGAGQVKQLPFDLNAGVYTVDVGIGGFRGRDGNVTLIEEIGLRANGGGAGGTTFVKDGAARGASGGGAGGRSDSLGGQGNNGNSGGGSTGDNGGGGGGGAGLSGQSAPVIIDNQTFDAGGGGDGIPITFDNKNYKYYGGGGAGDSFSGTLISGGAGGGGSTLQSNGVDGTGGGGAGNGGAGGKGYCLIGYVPVTTPAPITTTPRPPTVPSTVRSLVAIAGFDNIKLQWLDPEDVGTQPLTEYQIRVKRNVDNQFINTIDIPYSSVIVEGTELREYTIDSLDVEVEYTFDILPLNAVGYGDVLSVVATTVTTTTTTTTINPEFVSMIIDYDGEVTEGYIGQDGVTITGPEGSERAAYISLYANGDFVFYEEPTVLIFGDGSADILADNIQTQIRPDKQIADLKIPIIMPFRPETRATVFIRGEAVATTTTTTTTSTTTLPPLCTSMYYEASITADEDGVYTHTPVADRLLKPLQLFVSKSPFPYQITGSALPSSILAGSPWFGGVYFEIARTAESGADYIDDLNPNHNSVLLVQDLPDGSQETLDISYYKIYYPPVTTNEVNYVLPLQIHYNSTNNHRINLNLNLDYICGLDNLTPQGSGEETITGFTSMSVTEVFGIVNAQLLSNVINDFNYRYVSNFISQVTGETYYIMLDYGTRDQIIGA